MTQSKIKQGKIADLIPDDRNANKGTVRGAAMIEDGLRKYGAGRSILVDKNNKIIAGNKTTEGAVDIGLTDAIIVETTGHELIVVKRTDLDIDSPEGRGMALLDNRANETSLEWDNDVLRELADEGVVELKDFWWEAELDRMLAVPETLAGTDGERGKTPEEALQSYENATIKQITLYFGNEEYDDVVKRLAAIREAEHLESNTEAFLTLLERYENSTREPRTD